MSLVHLPTPPKVALEAQGSASTVQVWEEGTVTPSAQLIGSGSTATNTDAVAEGENTEANGVASHSEGQSTTASGNASHAEGNHTIAQAVHSHAQGSGSWAYSPGQSAHSSIAPPTGYDGVQLSQTSTVTGYYFGTSGYLVGGDGGPYLLQIIDTDESFTSGRTLKVHASIVARGGDGTAGAWTIDGIVTASPGGFGGPLNYRWIGTTTGVLVAADPGVSGVWVPTISIMEPAAWVVAIHVVSGGANLNWSATLTIDEIS